jgi:predicted nucleic acid-binding protein
VVVVDSSGWIEFFTDGPKPDAYARYLKDLQNVATPAVVVYEFTRRLGVSGRGDGEVVRGATAEDPRDSD